MYHEYFGLDSMPFGHAPAAGNAFQSRAFLDALDSLRCGLDGGARLCLLTGVAGVGKTVLLHQLRPSAQAHGPIIRVSADGVRDADLLAQRCCDALAPEATEAAGNERRESLRELLAQRFRTDQRTLVLIDDAHLLASSVLKQLPEMLGLAETESLQVILSGQPLLEARSITPDSAPFCEVVDVQCRLRSMSDEDVGGYILHQLRLAGHAGDCLFTASAIDAITLHCAGIPRRIDTLCGISLLIVFERGMRQVTPDIVHEAVMDQADVVAGESTPAGDESMHPLDDRVGGPEPAANAERARGAGGPAQLSGGPIAILSSTPASNGAADLQPRRQGKDHLRFKVPFVAMSVITLASLLTVHFYLFEPDESAHAQPSLEGELRTQLAQAEADRQRSDEARRVAEASAADILSAAQNQVAQLKQEQARLAAEMVLLRSRLTSSPQPSQTTDAIPTSMVAGALPGSDTGSAAFGVGPENDRGIPPVAGADQRVGTGSDPAGAATTRSATPGNPAAIPAVASSQVPSVDDSVKRPVEILAHDGAVEKSGYVVTSGDTLWAIAGRLDVSTADLRRWNSLDSDVLHVGTRLAVSGPPAEAQAEGAAGLLASASSARPADTRRHLRKGVTVEAIGEDGKSALMRAAINNDVAVAGSLLERAAPVNLRSSSGDTALTYAAWHGHCDVLSTLIAHEANIDAQNNGGRSALINASINGHTSCVQRLLENGANVNLRDRDGRSALSAAVWNDHVQIARHLLRSNANVNMTNRDGWTPLLDAAWNGNTVLVTLLLDHGANPGVKARNGLTPLQAARQRGHSGVTSVLLATGKLGPT